MLRELRFYVVCILIAVVVVSVLLPWTTVARMYTGGGRISESNQEVVDAALEKFTPELRTYLASIPIVYGEANTALALTTGYVPSGREYIVVSRDWDKTWGESALWEDVYSHRGYDKGAPAFSDRFKLNLLVHEYLHHVEQRVDLDVAEFYEVVTIWYQDPVWGSFESDDNYAKYYLHWNVYGGNGKRWGLLDDKPKPGVEEFAHLGQLIANGSEERSEGLSPTVLGYYKGILSEEGE